MKPFSDSDWFEYLDPAADQIQRLTKKLRRLLNSRLCDAADLNDCMVALEAIRRIYARHKLPALDRDRGPNSRSRREDRPNPAE